MNAAGISAAEARRVTDEGHEAIFARCEGATVVPFSRSLAYPQKQAYAPLHEVQPGGVAAREETLGKHELLSVNAVLTHIAHSQDVPLEVLQALVEAEFSVTSVTQIPLYQFHNVMEFLIDLRMDSVRSRR